MFGILLSLFYGMKVEFLCEIDLIRKLYIWWIVGWEGIRVWICWVFMLEKVIWNLGIWGVDFCVNGRVGVFRIYRWFMRDS